MGKDDIRVYTKKVRGGDNAQRSNGPNVFFQQLYPEDGVVVETVCCGVSRTLYLRLSDLTRVLSGQYNEIIEAKSWQK